MKKKYNTKLFSSGAEFLVLAKLLLARIETYLAYENQEGYDLISINAKKNLSAKIQVKSKNFKGDSSFYLNKDDKTKSDFYVFAQTNSMTRDYKILFCAYCNVSDSSKKTYAPFASALFRKANASLGRRFERCNQDPLH